MAATLSLRIGALERQHAAVVVTAPVAVAARRRVVVSACGGCCSRGRPRQAEPKRGGELLRGPSQRCARRLKPQGLAAEVGQVRTAAVGLAEHCGGFGFGPDEARSALLRGFACRGARGAAGGFVLPLGQLHFCGNFRGNGLGPVLQASLRDTSHTRAHGARAGGL